MSQKSINILALFFFIILSSSSIEIRNGISLMGISNGNESEYFVSIFSNSYKVFDKQMDIWGYEDKSKIWICSYAMHDWKDLRSNAMHLLAFPREWMGNGTTPPPHRCEWLSSNDARMTCYSKHSSIEGDYIDAEIYEPTRSFTGKMVTNVINALYSECFINDRTKFKIRIYTNFAEKMFVKQLNERRWEGGHVVESIQLFATSVAAANYYYYALTDPSILHAFDEYVYKMNEIILKRHWHQIYLFALSQNLTENQLVNVVNAAKKPLSLYFLQNRKRFERISVMLLRPLLRRLHVPYQFCDTGGIHIESCFQYIQLSREITIESNLFEENYENTTRMFTGVVENFNFHIFGAQLPEEQIADAVRVPVQPKARIVLITDFVEKKFLEKLVAVDRTRFEIKIYALNNESYRHYQGRADVVTLVNPNNPGLIPFGRNESEPIYYISEENPFATNNLVIVVISTGTAILLTISFIIFCIIYRRRLHHVNWLHRLEQFKTEHLYAAYMNKSEKIEENIDHWELGWDQVVLTTEHLGRGAFGEVRKANLIGMASSTKTPTKMDCTKLQDEMEVAVKILPKHASNRARQSFLREIQMMKLLDNGHPCIVQMLGCMSRSQLALVLEFCPGGSLLEHVRKLAPKGEWVVEREMDAVKMCRPFPRWAWQIADGMAFLATKHLVHRDLAARNVLLDAEMVAKICDFGHCIAVEAENDIDINVKKAVDDVEKAKSNENRGEEIRKEDDGEEKEKMPIRWLAPECLERKIYSEKSDVWSFGVILHEIYTFGANPFDGIEHKELLNYIRHYRAQKPEMCPEKIFELMRQCFELEPEQRPNFIEIRNKLTRIIEEETGEYGYLALERSIFSICQKQL